MKKISNVIVMIISMILGGCIGYLGATVAFSSGKEFSPLDIVLLFIFMVIAYILQIIIHEGGHLVFGLLSGYTFISYRIGSLTWIKEDNRIKFKRFSLAGTLGQCLLDPPDYNDGHYSQVLYNLGGSLANITTSLIALVLYFFTKDIHFIFQSLLMVVLFGFYLGLINGFPLVISGMNNDGFNALQCHKDPYTKKAFWITLKINALNNEGYRLKDIDESYFQDVSPDDIHNSLASSLIALNLSHAMDQHDFIKAKEIIQMTKEIEIKFVIIHQHLIYNDEVYIQLVSNELVDMDSYSKKDFQKFIKAMKDYPAIIRTQYTYELLINNDPNAAQTYLDRFEKVTRTYPIQVDIELEKELMDYAYEIYTKESSN